MKNFTPVVFTALLLTSPAVASASPGPHETKLFQIPALQAPRSSDDQVLAGNPHSGPQGRSKWEERSAHSDRHYPGRHDRGHDHDHDHDRGHDHDHHHHHPHPHHHGSPSR